MVNRVEVWVRFGVRDWLGVWVGVRVKVGFRVRVGIVRRSEGNLFNLAGRYGTNNPMATPTLIQTIITT